MFLTILEIINKVLIYGLAAAWLLHWILIIVLRLSVGNVWKAFGASLVWPPIMYVRFWLIVAGLVVIPLSFIGDGKIYTADFVARIYGNIKAVPQHWLAEKGDSLFQHFWWMAIRNPTAGLASLWDQPIAEPQPNPDKYVYGKLKTSAARYLRDGPFSEVWYLRAVGEKKFEIRIGFKYADGSPGFLPTVQFRLGN